jgi:recombination protein RecA
MAKKDKEPKEEVHEALVELRKKYGADVLTRADEGYPPVEAIPTGCFAIDRVIGCGGLPRGRIMELYGEPSSGKTATTLYFIAEVQKAGGTCAFLDAEYSFNGEFATSIGVDTKKLFVAQPATLEEAADILRALIATNQMDLIVVDSVAALVPKREVEGEEMLANSMAVQAQLMSKMLRILTGEVARSKTCLIFINHLKEKMGLTWGDKTTTPGGKSLKFFASVRLAISRGDKIKGKNDAQIGSVIKVVAQKNKVAPPWRKGEFTLHYATGVEHEADTLDTAEELEVAKKTGNTYSFGEEKIGIGRDQSIQALKDNPELYEKLRAATQVAVTNEKQT